MNLKNIVWKDLLKPRYAVVFVVDHHPTLNVKDGDFQMGRAFFACVRDRPYKRPLDMPFNVFYNLLSKRGNVVAGYGWVLRLLYGIGSTNSHNMANPILLKTEKPISDRQAFGRLHRVR